MELQRNSNDMNKTEEFQFLVQKDAISHSIQLSSSFLQQTCLLNIKLNHLLCQNYGLYNNPKVSTCNKNSLFIQLSFWSILYFHQLWKICTTFDRYWDEMAH